MNKAKKENRIVWAFLMGAFLQSLGTFGFFVLEDEKDKKKQENIKDNVADFAASQPNYSDSLTVFDNKNSASMAEYSAVIDMAHKNKRSVPNTEVQYLVQKIANRNQLAIKKKQIDQLVKNYTDSIQKINNIRLNDSCLLRHGRKK